MSTSSTFAGHMSAPTWVLPAVLGSDQMVPLADGSMVPFANFDHAATAPAMQPVVDAVHDFLPWYSSTHRGAGTLSNMCTARFEEARLTVRRFVGCRDDDVLIFTRNTTDALNLLAAAVPERTTVVVFTTEHHANLLPWRRVCPLPVPESVDELLSNLKETLRRLGPDVLVAVTAASNVTGELFPLADIVHIVRSYGARIVVDAAQYVSHRPIDMADWDVDYIAFSGHKMYAPFGIGVLAGRADWLAGAEPYLRGGGATVDVTDDAQVTWAVGAARHEAGTPNVLGAIALAAACDALRVIWDSLVPYESALYSRLRSGLADTPDVVELSLFGSDSTRVGIVSFAVEDIDSALLASVLSVEYGIGVRQGRFCAHPLTRHLLGMDARSGSSGAAIRVSLGLGIGVEKVDRLVDAIRTVSEIGPGLRYTARDGVWWPDQAVGFSSELTPM